MKLIVAMTFAVYPNTTACSKVFGCQNFYEIVLQALIQTSSLYPIILGSLH